MKKQKIAVVIILVLLATCLFACKNTDFSVSFDGNGGTLVSGEVSQTIEKGGSATAPVFTKEGYILSWDKAFDNITEAITVTAVWTIKTYTVNFDGNGGTFVSGDVEQTIEHGSAATAPVFTKDGYTLTWDKVFDNVTEAITVTAVWTKVYIINFDGNGGTLVSGSESQIIEHGSAATAPVFTKGGYTLSWDKAFDNVTEDMTVTAVWTIKTYTVNFDGNDGTFVSGDVEQTIEHGSAATAPIFTKEGYDLSWDKAFDNVIEEMTITAVWTIKTYAVTFDGNGGTLVSGNESQTVEHGSAATAPVFTKEGYILTWDKDFDSITEVRNVTAVWMAKVEYVTNGGNEIESYLVDPGTKISEPECSLEGYILVGWYTSSNDGEALDEMWSFDSDIVQSNLTLYAKWERPFNYTKSGDDYVITGLTEAGRTQDALEIPAQIEGNPISGIDSFALQNNPQITSVNIADGITSIGDYAFYGCTGLASITFPDSITSIGGYAFENCSALISITVPDSVTSIGHAAFKSCSGLTSITIPFVGATLDGTSQTYFIHIFGAFSYGSGYYYVPASLKTVIITGGASIGANAFSECSGLTSITIPVSVTSIGSRAFELCSGLTSITVAEGNTNYHSDGNCLIETSSKTLITGCSTSVIPSDGSVTSILTFAFYKCSGLTSITIPESITSIGYWAFYGCSGLTSITIPKSVTSMGNEVFGRCGGLASITVAAENPVYKSDGNNLIKKSSNALLAGSTNSVIPEYVTSIENYAFSERSGLTSITIPDSVTFIGASAFSGCSGLTSINIPEGIKYITSNVFSGCSALTSITIPASVTRIDREAFAGCSGLTSITVATGNTKYHSDGNCVIETTSKTLVVGCKNSVIPTDGSVTTIGDRAFSGCTSLTSIIIPESVTTIVYYAFTGCTGLTSIIIPTSVTAIGPNTFLGCTGLTIYARAASNPSGWQSSWNGSRPVVWGYAG